MRCAAGALVLSGILRIGAAIMCFECNSASNSQCNLDVLPASLIRNCSELDRGVTHTLCRKMIQHVDHGINGLLPQSRIIRTCGWDDSKYKGKCYHRSGYGGRQEVCSCTKDYCNGADADRISSALMSLTIVYAIVLLLQ